MNLPPQAYTRETLTAAFTWLHTQPEATKKLATNPDQLVALYLKAQRSAPLGHQQALDFNLQEEPSQSFSSDLKNLAEGLRKFDEPSPVIPASAHVPLGMQYNQHAFTQPTSTASARHHATVDTNTKLSQILAQNLHPQAWHMLQDAKSRLNISSDTEAVNLLITLAYKSIRNLLA